MLARSLVGLALLPALLACGAPANGPAAPEPATQVAVGTVSAPPSAGPTTTEGAPPPSAERGTDAHFIESVYLMGGGPAKPEGAVCATTADCEKATAGAAVTAQFRSGQEAWVVLRLPAPMQVFGELTSDGATATATVAAACPSGVVPPPWTPRAALYRVAPSVTKVVLVPGQPPCPKVAKPTEPAPTPAGNLGF